MFDYGLDEANVVFPAAHHQAAFEAGSASEHGIITKATNLQELLGAHSLSAETRASDGALVIIGYDSTKEWGGTRALFEALAPYVEARGGQEEPYLVWGCREFVERWHFVDGQLVETSTSLVGD